MKRLHYIDIARGIGVILVVIGHLAKVYEGVGQWIYSFHMPLFFIISGCLFAIKKETNYHNIKSFIISRLKSIAFPYITLSVLNILYDIVMHGLAHATGYIIDTLTLNGILALWFLPALFFSEVLLFLWQRLFFKTRLISIMVFLIAIILAATYSYLRVDFNNYSGLMYYLIMWCNTLCRAIYGFIFLIFGYLGFELFSHILLTTKRKIVISVFSIICGIINVCFFSFNRVLLSSCEIGNFFFFYVNAISGSCFIIGISYLLQKYLKLFIFYGKNSLVIFSTHLNFGIISLATKLWRFGVFETFGVFLIVLIIETLLAWAVNKYFSFIVSYKDFSKLISKIKQR